MQCCSDFVPLGRSGDLMVEARGVPTLGGGTSLGCTGMLKFAAGEPERLLVD